MPRGRARAIVIALVAFTASTARGENPGGGAAGAVGRAGAGVVGADDAAAFWLNPAGLARRGDLRLELGTTWTWRSVRFTSAEIFGAEDPAELRQLAVPSLAPTLAAATGLGSRWVVGLALLLPVDDGDGWAQPGADLDLAKDYEERRYLPHRYAAGAFELQQRGAVAAVSLRALPWLAVGASAWLMRVSATDSRTIWGGLGTVSSVPTLSAAFDMRFSASADGWSSGGSLGVLVAPPELPLELAASVAYAGEVSLAGTPGLRDSRGVDDAMSRLVRAEVADDAQAHLVLAQPLVLRVGTRFLAERWSLELDGELRRTARTPTSWQIEGVSLNNPLATEPEEELTEVPIFTPRRHAFALRLAADWEAVPGFLTLTSGYAWTGNGATAVSLALPDGEAHTLALGSQLRAGGLSVGLGVAWTLPAERATDELSSRVIAPFAKGGAAAARGTLDRQSVRVGVSVEATF